MVKIKLTLDAGGNKAGEEIEVTKGAAEYLVEAGYAETSGRKPAEKPAPKEGGGGSPE